MGAWGAGSFDNDAALDFVAEAQREGVDALREAFDQVGDDYIDADAGSAAIAAAELVAAALGRPAGELPPSVRRLVPELAQEGVEASLVERAERAVAAVSARDELYDLWTEGEAAAWFAVIADLKARLGVGNN